MLSLEQGETLVKFARKSINQCFKGDFFEWRSEFSVKQGVFVTLLNFPSHELRGCIGFPYPELPLGKAVLNAAKAAAFSDPRFQPLEQNELSSIIIELSVLTKPEEIKSKKELGKKIKIGKDGLIVNFQDNSGLLLPQVAVEWKWDSEEFIKQTCIKAGLHPEAWRNPQCRIYTFQAQVFSEKKPNGKVIEKS
ncbi:MAG: TIGR00296 family protein [archaeon]